MRQISSASLPERHIRVPKQSYIIDFGDNFIFGELVYRRVGLSTSWSVGKSVVGEFDCRRVGLSASWFVGELVCRRVGLSASCPVTGRSVPLSFMFLNQFHSCPINEIASSVRTIVHLRNDNYIPRVHARHETHPKMIFPVHTQLTS